METQNLTPEQKQDLILNKLAKTERYLRWQLYITVAFVIIPLIATLVLLPMVLKSVGGVINSSGVLMQ